MIRYISILVSLLIVVSVASAQEKRRIEVEQADSLCYNKSVVEAERLIGDVVVSDRETIMNCDSAYLFSEEDRLKAFGSVHINKGDTLHIYGDSLYYQGDIGLLEVTGNVIMRNSQITLYTQKLYYDLELDKGYYNSWGKVIDSTSVLNSLKGIYFANQKTVYFKDSVTIVNDDFDVESDSLYYNTEQKIATILGHTKIISEDGTLFADKGWYNTTTKNVDLTKNAKYVTETQSIKAKRVKYTKIKGRGDAYGDVEIFSKEDDVYIMGDKAVYFDLKEHTTVTGAALFKQCGEEDTLYMHADTLISYSVLEEIDSISELDSISIDSILDVAVEDSLTLVEEDISSDSTVNALTEEESDSLVFETLGYQHLEREEVVIGDKQDDPKIFLAHYHVRFFKEDMQGQCDSLSYTMSDSIISMFKQPVLWTAANQMTGDLLTMKQLGGGRSLMNMYEHSFVIMEKAENSYNQIKGKNMIGYIYNNELYKLDVKGSAKSVYYVEDEEQVIGLNHAESSDISIRFKERQIQTITYIQDVDMLLTPPSWIEDEQRVLSKFIWLDDIRPKDRYDIYVWKPILEQ